jgi:hypothetical protein
MNYLLYDAIWNVLREARLSQSKCDELSDKLYNLFYNEQNGRNEDEE